MHLFCLVLQKNIFLKNLANINLTKYSHYNKKNHATMHSVNIVIAVREKIATTLITAKLFNVQTIGMKKI
jgi:hypothetical protein